MDFWRIALEACWTQGTDEASRGVRAVAVGAAGHGLIFTFIDVHTTRFPVSGVSWRTRGAVILSWKIGAFRQGIAATLVLQAFIHIQTEILFRLIRSPARRTFTETEIAPVYVLAGLWRDAFIRLL